MVVGVFPIAKLGSLLVRQISKPIANFVKERAKQNYFFRTYVCMPPAQCKYSQALEVLNSLELFLINILFLTVYNWCEIRCKMWMMNMGKPDTIPRLNEQMAIELGANLLGESIVFTCAATLLLLEYSRQSRKEMAKEAAREEETEKIYTRLTDLCFQVESQSAQIRRLEHLFAELESNAITKPWRGSTAPPKDVKPPAVTKNETSSNLCKDAPPGDQKDAKGR